MTAADDIELAETDNEKRTNFLAYPSSTLSPKIVPNDLTSFKSRGATKVQKALRQQLTELQEQYHRVIDEFNWNKLVYEAEFGFEPILGETYHLYDVNDVLRLSMIGPGEWSHRFLGSFRLDSDGRWNIVEVAEGFDLQTYLEESEE